MAEKQHKTGPWFVIARRGKVIRLCEISSKGEPPVGMKFSRQPFEGRLTRWTVIKSLYGKDEKIMFAMQELNLLEDLTRIFTIDLPR